MNTTTHRSTPRTSTVTGNVSSYRTEYEVKKSMNAVVAIVSILIVAAIGYGLYYCIFVAGMSI